MRYSIKRFITLQAVAADPRPHRAGRVSPIEHLDQRSAILEPRGNEHRDLSNSRCPAGTNSFTVTIQAVDLAGNTNQATQTWVVNTSAATNAPALTNI